MCTKKKHADGKPGIRFAGQEMIILVGALKMDYCGLTPNAQYVHFRISQNCCIKYWDCHIPDTKQYVGIDFDFIVVRLVYIMFIECHCTERGYWYDE